MAWTYQQLFNGLTDGDLNGQDSWSGSAAYDVTTETSYEGAKDLKLVAIGSYLTIERVVTGVAAGVVYVSMKWSEAANTAQKIELRNQAGALSLLVYFNGSNILGLIVGDYITIQASPSADTWYRVGMEWEDTNHTIRYNVNNGTWSAWQTPDSSWTTIDKIDFTVQQSPLGSLVARFDTISPNYTPVVATVAGYPPTLLFMNAG
mgnify:CR=1 FL=1